MQEQLQRLVQSIPGLFLVVRADHAFTIEAASDDYLIATHTDRSTFGHPVFNIFPENPAATETRWTETLRASFEQVIQSRKADTLSAFRYDVRHPAKGGEFEERYWNVINAPVVNEAGVVEFILQRIEEASAKRKRDAVAILESITEGFFTLDRQWRFDYVNGEAHRILGRERGSLEGRVLWEEYPGLEGTRFEQCYHQTMYQREKTTFTAFYPVQERWYEVSTFPAPEGASVYFRDVTQSRQLQAERERLIGASENQRRIFETALNSTPDFIYVFDLNHRALYANQAFRSAWGVDDVRGKDWVDLGYEASHAASHDAEIDAVIASGAAVRGEMAFSKNGRRVYDYIFAPVVGFEGKVVAVAGTARDVTDRDAALKALRESEAKFKTIADAMPQMVWSTLPDGYHDYYNQQWYDFTGVPIGSTDGKLWSGMFHPADQSRAWERWQQSLVNAETYEIEYRLRHRSGQYRWVLGRALPVRDDQGAIVRWMGTCTDIHEQKLAQEELLANNRRKDEFLAMLAHELRNPLAPIATAAHLLKATPGNTANVERSAAIITRQVCHMTELVDDLLDVSRVTRGLVDLERSPVPLKAVLGSAIEQVRPLIESRGHQLTTRMPPGEVYVLGDRTRLVQVVSNLLNNAGKYTPPNGSLSLSMSVTEEVEVRVGDDGIGIDGELLPHVFGLFTQGERTPDRSQGGLGLGLALVRSLVELHGGRVKVESEGRGQGSVFTVTLPIMAGGAPVAAELTRTEAQPTLLPRRVMVVDDNQDAAETLAVLLQSQGYDVQVAHDASQALDTVGTEPLDVFILDIGLPGMDGFELARSLRMHPSGAAATYIALTGYGGEQERQRGSEAGFQHYLVKPADLRKLAELLRGGAA